MIAILAFSPPFPTKKSIATMRIMSFTSDGALFLCDWAVQQALSPLMHIPGRISTQEILLLPRAIPCIQECTTTMGR